MLNWIIVGILVICGIIAVKMNHLRHRIFIVLLVFLALTLYGTISIVGNMNDLDFTTTEGFVDATKIYFGWLANGFQNLKALAGNAINMDWSSSDSTFFNTTNIPAFKK